MASVRFDDWALRDLNKLESSVDILRPASVWAGECCNAQRNSVEGIMSKHFSCGNLCEGGLSENKLQPWMQMVGCSNPDMRFLSGPWTGLPAGRGFLSGRGVRGSVQNWPIFIRTVLRLVRKFWPIFIRTYLRHLRVLSGVLWHPIMFFFEFPGARWSTKTPSIS